MALADLGRLASAISSIELVQRFGTITRSQGHVVDAKGISDLCRIGDLVRVNGRSDQSCLGEVIRIDRELVTILPETGAAGYAIGDRVYTTNEATIAPSEQWLGRVIDPFGRPLDGRTLPAGELELNLRKTAPPAAGRNRLGARLLSGISAIDTFLPIVEGQRIGLFAGSGVGKSTLLADLARGLTADVVVIALVGERGREVREFVEDVLGEAGLARSVVVAATSDQSPMARRRAGWTAMSVAEYFSSKGQHVLFLADSLTRFAEAHREVSIAAGESSEMSGFPASTSQAIMGLCERAGPGVGGAGSISAVFSVLVAGSDMEEPVADTVRGVLDGHIVLDRTIAERGRFPAIDILRSVSRSLPKAATEEQNELLAKGRTLMTDYQEAAMMIQAGLYTPGSVPAIDAAVRARPRLEAFLTLKGLPSFSDSFARLEKSMSLDTQD